jgi:hypothetical protein
MEKKDRDKKAQKAIKCVSNYYYFLVGLVFELRASSLQSSCSDPLSYNSSQILRII